MKIIGRIREKRELEQCIESNRPEFLVIYGRRRVGKTYLIREYFSGEFSFYATGLAGQNTKGQLKAFHESLKQYGCPEKTPPKDWFEAFLRLKVILTDQNVYRESLHKKIVIFLDELPWMDTPRSDFKSALDYFWNSFASGISDLKLIVCGSATSWIIKNLLNDRGGFHNRITRRIRLLPFNLKECEELLDFNDIRFNMDQLLECYMVFGGIPYYLNLLDRRLSLAQNIEKLLFQEHGSLKDEYRELFYSLFKKPEKHMEIIKYLGKKKSGVTRKELSEIKSIGEGAYLTKNLLELEQCGFIRKFTNYTKASNEAYYQLIDPFVSFNISFGNKSITSWYDVLNSPRFYAWRGYAFENLCINHILQIKKALGISGISSSEYAWRSKEASEGVQIDLIIDRADRVVNICEMKYTDSDYAIEKKDYHKYQNYIKTFLKETKCKKAVHFTLVAVNGVKNNEYSGIVQRVITAWDICQRTEESL